MKIRLSCSLVAVVVLLGIGTMANAQPLIGVSCAGPVCTITETLYFPGAQVCGSNGPVAGCNNVGNPANATNAMNYVAPTTGNPTGTNLVVSTWDAVYTFDTYGFFNTGYSLASSTTTVHDASTGFVTLSQTSGGNNYYGWAIGVADTFTLNPDFIDGAFITDSNTIGSTGLTTTGSTGYLHCAHDVVSPINGSTDSTGCVYLVTGGGTVPESGFGNTVASAATPGALTTNVSGTANIYEQVIGADTINGPAPDSFSPNGASGASEIVLTFTYDLPQSNNGTPEPATLLLLGTGLSFVASRLRRSKSGVAK
jgi:hypothetical protein